MTDRSLDRTTLILVWTLRAAFIGVALAIVALCYALENYPGATP